MSSSPAKPEKTMSSRLLTMKFMQRAAATAATKDPSQPSDPDPDETSRSSSKRQRLSTDNRSPPDAVTSRSSDFEAISLAIAAEEDKRREALARQAAEAGETQWVLDFPTAPEIMTEPSIRPPFAVAAASLDTEDDDAAEYGGRIAFGNFKRKKRKEVQYDDEARPAANGEDDKDVDTTNPAHVEAMIRREQSRAHQKQGPRKVNLSRLTSISGGRQATIGDPKSQKKRKGR